MKNLIVIIVAGFSFGLSAQTADLYVISSIGGSFSNGSIDVNYTVGEAVIQTQSTAQIIVTQGFHQPNDVLGGIDDLNGDQQLLLYPNPVNDILNVDLNAYGLQNSEAELVVYDINGQVVHSETLFNLNQNGTIQLNVQALTPGHYLIRVVGKDSVVSRARFIKS